MSNYIQNNVNFTIQEYTPTKLGNRASTATYNALVNNKGSYIVNAVEIDWNGAQVAGQTLNTTGEVLSMLGYAYTANGESKDITLKIGNTEKTFNVNETSNVEWTLQEIGKGSRFANVVNSDIQSESDLTDYINAGEEYRNIQSVLIDWNAADLGKEVEVNLEGATAEGNSAVINTICELIYQ